MGLGMGGGYKLHKNGTKNTGDSTLLVVGVEMGGGITIGLGIGRGYKLHKNAV